MASVIQPTMLGLAQAQALLNAHFNSMYSVASVKEIECGRLSFSSQQKVFMLDLGSPAPATTFVILECASPTGGDYQINTLKTIHTLLARISSATDIPGLKDPILDSTQQHVPHTCLLTQPLPGSIIALADARAQGLLSPQDQARIDLQLGTYMGRMHSSVQNDWFGLPLPDGAPDPADPSYSWQETFTLLLETLLSEMQEAEAQNKLDQLLPYEDIRRYLSRAIGFFLFDDAEVPSLVWFTNSEDDIYLSSADKEMVAVLPYFAHALWGDPLLESIFLPPGPSVAFMEGYTASSGKQVLSLPRHKTKRLWYTVFLCLVVLREHGWRAEEKAKVQEVVDLLQKSVVALEYAPCY